MIVKKRNGALCPGLWASHGDPSLVRFGEFFSAVIKKKTQVRKAPDKKPHRNSTLQAGIQHILTNDFSVDRLDSAELAMADKADF